MCCPKNTFAPVYNANEQRIEIGPKNVLEYGLQAAQRMELAEKVAELADELFHLFREPLRAIVSSDTYAYFDTIHEGAHAFEHLLHSFCFLNDFVHIANGSFSKGNAAALIAKICHLASHILAPLQLLNDLNIIDLGSGVSPLQVIASSLSCVGYGISTINLLWQRFMEEHHHTTWVEITVQASGCCYHLFVVIQTVAPPAAVILAPLQAIAGVVHAAVAIYRLLPSDHVDLADSLVAEISAG